MATPIIIFSLMLAFVVSSHGQQRLRKDEALEFGKEKGLLPKKTHVLVYNDLDQNITLTLHCKSRHNGLGIHLLKKGEYFEWKFRPNIFGGTRFWCYMEWEKVSGTFQIYVEGRDQSRCRRCVWIVTEDGIRGYNREGGDEEIWFRPARPKATTKA